MQRIKYFQGNQLKQYIVAAYIASKLFLCHVWNQDVCLAQCISALLTATTLSVYSPQIKQVDGPREGDWSHFFFLLRSCSGSHDVS